MWIDTHCHLDASEFAGASLALAEAAAKSGVSAIVIPAVHKNNFAAVEALSQRREDCFYALGIHPIYVPTSDEKDLLFLREKVAALMSRDNTSNVATDVQSQQPANRFVAIGEIGLDFFVPALKESPLREKQEFFFSEQLKIAREFELPVLLHVRRSQDTVLKYLRRIRVPGGIAHAFNGSHQQAQTFIDLGFKLGLGGAMTYTRALQIRRLATELPLTALVLETDAPDMSPSWIPHAINTPAELPAIATVLAGLRGVTPADIGMATTANAESVLPRMRRS
ncbi:MAG: TatD family hydrolase [Burkholderiaceae bacterium]|nr:TatD family hydrolase [Burkholderiaceae bacterium]